MGASLQYEEHYTIEDYKRWEGDWELIEGRPYAIAPSPMVTHQWVSMNLTLQLTEATKNCPHCHALYEIDWYISQDTVVRPDNILICYEPEETIGRRPELIFEIISPVTARRDEQLKFHLYEREGVPYYTILYPEQKVAKVYKLQLGRYIKVGDFKEESVAFELDDCAITIDFSKVWRR